MNGDQEYPLIKTHSSDLLLLNGAKKGKTRFYFILWAKGFHSSGNHGNKPAFSSHIMCVRDEGDVDVRVTPHLLLGNDDLTREGILCPWNRVVQEADATHNLTNLDIDVHVPIEQFQLFIPTDASTSIKTLFQTYLLHPIRYI